MTDPLREARRILKEATPGPWVARSRDVSGKLDSVKWSGLALIWWFGR